MYVKLADLNDERYELLFEFLKISQTYNFLAHYTDFNSPLQNRSHLYMSPDIADVKDRLRLNMTRAYLMFGNVRGASFQEWINSLRGKQAENSGDTSVAVLNKFSKLMNEDEIATRLAKLAPELADKDKHKTDFMLVSVPLSGDHQQIQHAFSKIVADHIEVSASENFTIEFDFEKNKIRTKTLHKYLEILRYKIANPDAPLFVIGNVAGVSPENYTDPNEKRNEINRGKRQKMEIFTSRYIHRATLVAQNAGQGKFPSLDEKPQAKAQLDWEKLHELYHEELKDYKIT